MANTVGLSELQAEVVPQNFCIKYEPPTFGILYHLSNNKDAKFVHNVELQITPNSDAKEIANRLFQNECLYLDPKNVHPSQVEKLVNKIIMRKKHKPEEELKVPQNATSDNSEKMSAARERLLKRKGLMGVLPDQDKSVENPKPAAVSKPAPVQEPKKKQKVEETEFVIDDFADLDDQDLPFENQQLKQPDVPTDEMKHELGGSGQHEEKQQGQMMEGFEDAEVSGDNDEYIIIHDIQYRKIQIEGDEEEYLMDPEGNIFNMQGQFIGTANGDGAEGDEEEMEGQEDNLPFD